MKLTPKQREMLTELKAGPKLAGRWLWSGSRIPNQLLTLDLIEVCDHPTTMDRATGKPADAFQLTDKGREAIG